MIICCIWRARAIYLVLKLLPILQASLLRPFFQLVHMCFNISSFWKLLIANLTDEWYSWTHCSLLGLIPGFLRSLDVSGEWMLSLLDPCCARCSDRVWFGVTSTTYFQRYVVFTFVSLSMPSIESISYCWSRSLHLAPIGCTASQN